MKRLLIITCLTFLSFLVQAQTTPVSPVPLPTNSLYLEPSTGLRWGYNGATYGWYKIVSTAPLSYVFSNGLTTTGSNVKLGGVLTGNTTIPLSGFNFNLTEGARTIFTIGGNSSLMQGGTAGTGFGNVSANFLSAVLGYSNEITGKRQEFVIGNNGTVFNDENNAGIYYGGDNSVLGLQNDLWIPSLGAVKTLIAGSGTSVEATNGLTKVDSTIKLGGALTGTTLINSGSNIFAVLSTNGGLSVQPSANVMQSTDPISSDTYQFGTGATSKTSGFGRIEASTSHQHGIQANDTALVVLDEIYNRGLSANVLYPNKTPNTYAQVGDINTATANYLLKTDTVALARKVGDADMFQKTYTLNNMYKIFNFKTFASPPPDLQYMAIRPTTTNSPMRLGIIPSGTPTTANSNTFISGIKIFRTDFNADTLNNSDGGIYMTNSDFRINSKYNGTGLQNAPIKVSFQDTQIKAVFNINGLGLGGDVLAAYPLDINYSTALNDQGFNVLATETASNRTLYGGRITASNPSGTGSNIIGLQVTADKGATTGVMASTGLDVINNIGARAAGGTATTYRGANITLTGSAATSSTSTSVSNTGLQVTVANTTAVGEGGTDRGALITVTSLTGKTVKALELNASGGTTNIALDVVTGETRIVGATASTLAYFDSNKYLKTATQTGTGTTYVASVSPALTGTPTAPTAAAATNTTQLATTAFVTTADNLKANIASPALTGVPTAPTAATTTNTTQLATTAFVQQELTAAGRTRAFLNSNQTLVLNADYLATTTTLFAGALPPTTGFLTDGSKLITVSATGSAGARVTCPAGYTLVGLSGAATPGTGGINIVNGGKLQLAPVGTNSYQYYILSGSGTVN